jgi:hypothetical protein
VFDPAPLDDGVGLCVSVRDCVAITGHLSDCLM